MIIVQFKNLPAHCNARSDKGKIRKQAPVSHRAMNHIMKEIRRNSLQARKEVFESAGVPNVSKSTGCRILRRIGKCGKPEVRSPLKNIYKRKRIEWAKNNMKLNFQTFCSPMGVARSSMDPMDGGDDGSARRVHVLTRSSSSTGVTV